MMEELTEKLVALEHHVELNRAFRQLLQWRLWWLDNRERILTVPEKNEVPVLDGAVSDARVALSDLEGARSTADYVANDCQGFSPTHNPYGMAQQVGPDAWDLRNYAREAVFGDAERELKSYLAQLEPVLEAARRLTEDLKAEAAPGA